jgi:methyl-accepting chemotaxis protein
MTTKLFAAPCLSTSFLIILGIFTFLWFPGQKSQTETTVFFAILAGMVLVSIIFTAFMARSLRLTLGQITDVVRDVSEGDLAKRMKTTSDDAVGEIAKYLNGFLEMLNDTFTRVIERSYKISYASNTLEATAKEMSKGAHDIVTQINSVAAASEEMSTTSSEIARNCTIAAQSSDIISHSAISGENIIQGIVVAMNRIDDHVKESAAIIRRLGEKSDQIGEIAAIINDIADQTNLLALNAAIEAARAGEHGRGFAVVADEVRKLAERTGKATRDIGETILTMQSETKAAVASMENGVNEGERGVEETEKSGSALKEILHQINTLASQINQIAVASEQQTATTNEISGSIQNISRVMEYASKNIQENADATSQVASLSIELNKLVEKLRLQANEKSNVSGTAEDAKALIHKAVQFLRDHGKEKALTEFSNPKGQFQKGDLYIFANTLEGLTMAHGGNSSLIGKDMSGLKDAEGKYFIKEMIDLVKKKESGWIDYKWLNPGNGRILTKSTFCVRVDDIMLGCGIYK